MSLSQYQDKTLSVHLFALQQGYPLNEMTRTYKNKLKEMFEGGYKINFYQKYANSVLQQVIYHYFVPNLLMRWRQFILFDEKLIEILEDISGFMFLSFLFTKKGSGFIYKLKDNKESLKDE